jgi:Holliday junction DNA helicase RuvA
MIAMLTGKVVDKYGSAVILDIAGIGYEVVVPTGDFGAAHSGNMAAYFIHEHIREDAHSLYGFSSREAKQFFELLLGISGVGPKVAMAVISAAPLDRLTSAVGSGDPDLLRGVSGVGKKTAERIVVELKGKLAGGALVSSALNTDASYHALLGLGYTSVQAADALGRVDSDITDDSARLKAALKALAK